MISLIATVNEWYELLPKYGRLQQRCTMAEEYIYSKIKHHRIVMGRHTMEALKHSRKKDREIHVFSHYAPNITIDGYTFHKNLEYMLGADSVWAKNDEEIFVVGGRSMFLQTYKQASKLYVIMDANRGASHMTDMSHSCFPYDSWVSHIKNEGYVPKHETVVEVDRKDKWLTVTVYEKTKPE